MQPQGCGSGWGRVLVFGLVAALLLAPVPAGASSRKRGRVADSAAGLPRLHHMPQPAGVTIHVGGLDAFCPDSRVCAVVDDGT